MRKLIRLALFFIIFGVMFLAIFGLGRASAGIPPVTLVVPNTSNSSSVARVEAEPETDAYSCPGALEPRLTVGDWGWVDTNDPRPLNFRMGPSTDTRAFAQLQVGTEFQIISGPVCAQDMNWWRIEAESQTGWISEGQGDLYFVSPLD